MIGCWIQRGRLIRITMIPWWRRMRYSVQRRLGWRPIRLLAGPLLTTSYTADRWSGWSSGDDLGSLLRLWLWLLLRWRWRRLAWVLNPIGSTITIVLISCIWPSCKKLHFLELIAIEVLSFNLQSFV